MHHPSVFMTDTFVLEELPDDALDAILSLPPEAKDKYFSKMAQNFNPKVDIKSDYFKDIVETYISSFYLEKLYRTNRFFNEKFTPVYTNTGIIRNIIADIYFTDDDLITH